MGTERVVLVYVGTGRPLKIELITDPAPEAPVKAKSLLERIEVPAGNVNGHTNLNLNARWEIDVDH